MIALIQKVSTANVSVQSKKIAETKKGLLVFLGIYKNDDTDDIFKVSKKILNLRIFNNNRKKAQLSITDIAGEILLISQFTLCADVKKGNRPSFSKAMHSTNALTYFNLVHQELNKSVITKKGIFGEDMKVSLINEGPITIIVNTKNE